MVIRRPLLPGCAAKRSDSVGINRRGVVNERVIQERSSDPSWPRAMRGRPVRTHLKRWTGVYVGWPLSSENRNPGCRRSRTTRKAIWRRALARVRRGPAESKTPSTHRNTTRENREAPWPPLAARLRAGGRSQKHKSHMHGSGESYSIVVPAKQPNKGGNTAGGGCGGKDGDQGEHGAI
jgi:hypothetical protein